MHSLCNNFHYIPHFHSTPVLSPKLFTATPYSVCHTLDTHTLSFLLSPFLQPQSPNPYRACGCRWKSLFCIIPTYMPLIFSDIPYSPFGTPGCRLGCSGSFLNMLALRNTLFSTFVNYLSSMILYFISLRSFRWGLNLSFLPTAANRSAET